MSMEEIHNAISRRFDKHKYKLFNSYVFNWECDYFSITPDEKYIYEVEVKLSRSDFKADFQKHEKHKWLSSAMTKETIVCPSGIYTYESGKKVDNCTPIKYIKVRNLTPNRFFYCCPKEMISVEECPEYAGLIYMHKGYCTVVKPAPFIHKQKNVEKYLKTLVDKFYFQFEKMRVEYKYFRKEERQYDLLLSENRRLIEAIEIEKNGGLLKEIENLKSKLSRKENECHKLKADNGMLQRKVSRLESPNPND